MATKFDTLVEGREVPVPSYTPENKYIEETVDHDGVTFYTTFWPTPKDKQSKGRIVFVHGFCEYAKLYVRLFDHLVSHGYEVFFFDQRGSGWTSPGKQQGVTKAEQVMSDLDFFLEKNIGELGPEEPLFLGGHSMGGGIVLDYGICGKHADRLNGIFTTGPLIQLVKGMKPPYYQELVLRMIAKVLPMFRFEVATITIDKITSDPEWRKFVEPNPLLSPTWCTLGQMVGMLKRGDDLSNPEYIKGYSKVPLFIIHGTDDKINDPRASEKFIKLAPIEDKKLLLIPNCQHSISIEAQEQYETMRTALFEWLDQHL